MVGQVPLEHFVYVRILAAQPDKPVLSCQFSVLSRDTGAPKLRTENRELRINLWPQLRRRLPRRRPRKKRRSRTRSRNASRNAPELTTDSRSSVEPPMRRSAMRSATFLA